MFRYVTIVTIAAIAIAIAELTSYSSECEHFLYHYFSLIFLNSNDNQKRLPKSMLMFRYVTIVTIVTIASIATIATVNSCTLLKVTFHKARNRLLHV